MAVCRFLSHRDRGAHHLQLDFQDFRLDQLSQELTHEEPPNFAANADQMSAPAEPKPPEVAAQSSGEEGEIDIETVSAMPRRRAARVSAELCHRSANMHHNHGRPHSPASSSG